MKIELQTYEVDGFKTLQANVPLPPDKKLTVVFEWNSIQNLTLEQFFNSLKEEIK